MPEENDNYIITYNFIVLGESLLKKKTDEKQSETKLRVRELIEKG